MTKQVIKLTFKIETPATNLDKLREVVHVLYADAAHGVGLLVQEQLLHNNVVSQQQHLQISMCYTGCPKKWCDVVFNI